MKNFPKSDGVDKDVGSGNKFSVFDGLMCVFLIFNLVIRFCTIFYYPSYNAHIAGFFGVIVSCCIFVILFPKYLKAFLFIFGFSFFLFGFGAIDIQSRVFELIVTCVATTLFAINWRAGKDRGRESGVSGQKGKDGGKTEVGGQIHRLRRLHGLGKMGKDGGQGTEDRGRLNRRLVVLILCYVGLSLFSLLLLPVRQILKDFWFFGFPDAFFYLFTGPLYGIYLPVTAVIQLALFVALAIQLSSSSFSVELYKSLFTGIFSGAVFCAFIGLLDFYGIISLAWYRFGQTVSPGVLHSTFQNRNCFGEFVLTVIPFVMIGFLSKIKGVWWKVFLFGCLVICEIALILAGGRAGWVTYPLILFICWLFSYFSKEGRLQSFHFRLRDLVKVAISVPVTIVISLLLIFCILMPLGEQLKKNAGMAGINTGSKGTAQFLKSQIKTIQELDLAGRDSTWGQGLNVGRESPVFGMGYESFFWHANVLTEIPESYFDKFVGKREFLHESPHNVFFSIFVSGGVVGVCLWLLVIGYSVIVLIFDLVRNKKLLNIPVIISIISFHTYGMVQSMQYIPMIWLLIFLSLGYAMTIDDGVLPFRLRRGFGVLTKGSVVLVVIGFFVYLGNFESRSLAQKYGLRIYAMDQERDKFAGFFQHSKRWQYGDYRWSGKRGSVVVSGQGAGGRGQKGKEGGQGVVEFEFHCRTPGVEKEPVVLTVFHDGKLIDKISFTKKGSIRKKYDLQETSGKTQELILEVSRTWNPHNILGNFDRRELGVGVKILMTEVGDRKITKRNGSSLIKGS
ncbi:MAG: O-antigen ligase family protein [Pseudomonadota bacterium]